ARAAGGCAAVARLLPALLERPPGCTGGSAPCRRRRVPAFPCPERRETMSETTTAKEHAVLTEQATLEIQRLLPGPVERVWDYLTRSDLRREWLAAGDMPMAVGAGFELVWRNDELSKYPGARPPGI